MTMSQTPQPTFPFPALARLRTAVLAAVRVGLALSTAAAAALEPAFLPPSGASPPVAALGSETPNGRPVTIHPQLRALKAVQLELAPDVVLDAERTHLQIHPNGDFVWSGRLLGEPLSQVIIASREGAVSGHVNRPLEDGNELYTIRPTSSGFSVVSLSEPGEGPDGCESVPVPQAARTARPSSRLHRTAALATTGFPEATDVHPAVIDVLALYTPATTTRYGSAAGAEALILEGIASANLAYQNSGVFITLRLVHAAEIPYTETSAMGTALARLADPSDGYLDAAHALRDEHGADLVVLLDEDADYCGIAFQMSVVDTAFAAHAFSVIHSGCISAFSMTHEMGHNMGSHHDRANAYGAPAYPYSYGCKYCTTDGTGFRTVMSYACTDAAVPRVNYFSNPAITFNGQPTGVPSSDLLLAADNAMSLNNTALTVAAFRIAVISVPAAPAGLSATPQGATAISLAWTDTSLGEDYQQVGISSDALAWNLEASLPSNVTSYSVDALEPGTTHWFRVRACNGSGCSDWSPVVSATTLLALPPSAPAGLTAIATDATHVRLAWTDTSQDESGFRLERSPDGISFATRAVLPVNAIGYVDETVLAGQVYHYRLFATGALGDSAASNVATVTTPTPSTPPPAAPTTLAATAKSSSSIRLTWRDRSTNETGFQIERSADDGWTYVTIVTTAPGATSYTNTGLAPNRKYRYRVRAVNALAVSGWSNIATATTKR